MTFLVGAYYLSRRNNYFYLIPIFIFFSLIAQVYFATMEIFPGRYLCLLPLFIIPISLSFLYHDSHLSKTTFFIGAISLILLDLITTSVRLNSLSDKVLSDQIAVGSFISTTNSPCVVYLKSSASPRFDHSAFWYFSRLPMTKVIFQRVDDPYTNYKLPTTCYLVVVEKTPEHPGNKESIPRFFGQPIFENFYFQVFEPPVIKNRVLNGQK
jgi:hypothetical protein